jgi:hypothetical protein
MYRRLSRLRGSAYIGGILGSHVGLWPLESVGAPVLSCLSAAQSRRIAELSRAVLSEILNDLGNFAKGCGSELALPFSTAQFAVPSRSDDMASGDESTSRRFCQ